MEVVICESQESACENIAKIIVSQISKKSNSTLGLATGASPKGVYAKLVQYYDEDMVDFSKVRSFNLDEYVGLGPNHMASYHSYMQRTLFSKINIQVHNTIVPNGMAEDIPQECQAYENKILSCGGIDLQLLGIGTDGHIGFNEPTSSLQSRTRIKSLTEETISSNEKYFSSHDEIPRHVITMGIATIMDAKRIILMAFGESKAAAVREMVEGPISAMVPATVLQNHQRVTVFLDDESSSKLEKTDYYKWVLNNKPQWQREF